MIKMKNEVTVTSRGMVTIPSKLRKKLNIKDGSKLIVKEHKLGLLYIPIIELEDLFGADSKELGYEMIREIHEDRRKERIKKTEKK